MNTQLLILALLAVCVCLLGYLAFSHYRTTRPHDFSKDPDVRAYYARHPDAPAPPAVQVSVSPDEIADAIIPQDFSKAASHTRPRDPRPYDVRIKLAVAATIDGLRDIKVRADPLLAVNLSHLYSLMGSAISRHGHLIELAIFEALNDQKNFAVWRQQPIKIPNGNGGARIMPVDLIVFDARTKTIRAYEIKRGFSESLSSHVERQTRTALPAVEPYLKEFAASQGLTALNTFTHVFSYYGRSLSAAGDGPTLNEHVMDEHFETPGLRREVETVSELYKIELQKLIEELDLYAFDTPRIGTVQREQAKAEAITAETKTANDTAA